MQTAQSNLIRFWHDDKTSELALFYNLAFDRVARFIEKEEVGQTEAEKVIKNFARYAFADDFKTGTYIKLKNYLWKGYSSDRNSSGTTVSSHEKSMIRQMLSKLEQIRNFQSHVYHSNEMLEFDAPLRSFLETLYNDAVNSLMEKYPNEVSEYKARNKERSRINPRIKEIFIQDALSPAIHRLSYEGKNFFLSLFLTTGEMKRFLKQRRGCKRDDTKDFRVKHEIYTFYCHRDGASRFHYNQDETFLSNSDDALVREILRKRQLYKINTYLNDVSSEIADTSLFPLFTEGRIAGSSADLISLCKSKAILKDLIFQRAPVVSDHDKRHDPGVLFCHKDFEGVLIRVSHETFHRLIVDVIRMADESSVLQKIVMYSEERCLLIRLVQTAFKELPSTESDGYSEFVSVLEEYELFRLRSNHDGLRRKFAQWHTALLKKVDTEAKLRADLLTKTEQLPVELRYLDFYYEEERKPRQSNDFMRFAVQYLVDFNVMPFLSWQWQAFNVRVDKDGKSVLTETTCLSPAKPTDGNWRLKFTHDDQILVAYENGTAPENFQVKRKNKEIFQTYLIGHRAMRNLLIAHVHDHKDLKPFFSLLEADVMRLHAGEIEKVALLDRTSIPPSFISKVSHDLRAKVVTRMDTVANELKRSRTDGANVRRAEKNRQIMRCYRLFSWEKRKSNGVEIYLRKNEYSQLSIYHYTLENGKNRSILDRVKETNHLPQEVLALLNRSRSLDELYQNTINETLSLVEQWRGLVNSGLPLKHVKVIARKLGVPVYDKTNDNRHVPFAIHPILPVKALYGEKFTDDSNFSLSEKIWRRNDLKAKLYNKNYDYDNYFNYWGGREVYKEKYKKEYRAIIGNINQSVTYDTILFLIGQRYDENFQRVENMHDAEIALYASNKKISNGKFVRVSVKYKQLADILTSMNEEKIENTALHLLRRIGDVSPSDQENEGKPDIVVMDKHNYTVPFVQIKQETHRIYHSSLVFIDALFSLERQVIEADALAATLRATKPASSSHLNFMDILDLSGIVNDEDRNELSDIRNHALHGLIPRDWSYSDKVDNQFLAEFLATLKYRTDGRKNSYRSLGGERFDLELETRDSRDSDENLQFQDGHNIRK